MRRNRIGAWRGRTWVAACGALLACAAGCGPEARDGELAFYAAASLRDAVEELAPACARATGVTIRPHFAGSGALARQIELGGRADVFFSADPFWIDRLARQGRIDTASRVAPLRNALVVVVPRGTPERKDGAEPATTSVAVATLRAVRGRIAIADPETVPAGRHARTWLQREGLWDALAPRIVPALDVRAALAAVESGAADAGVVYATDAAASTRVRVGGVAPEAIAPEAVYALAALAGRPRTEDARRVVAWFAGPEAAAVFRRHGFRVAEAR